ncbi:MAG: hypothetical protein QNJ19_06635 [Woeseiaceae bacterium]|nr:hypothetical protein [Woeseiaceae bacterium]
MSPDTPITDLTVADVMVPLSGYTTIELDASLAEAFDKLSGALKGEGRIDPSTPRDFAVLVLDSAGDVVGRLVVWDILKGLEPQGLRDVDALSMVDGLGAWEHPLSNLAEKVEQVRVRDLVEPLAGEELIDVAIPLNVAVHRLIRLRALSLIATRDGRSVGVLRVVDAFARVAALVSDCSTDPDPR